MKIGSTEWKQLIQEGIQSLLSSHSPTSHFSVLTSHLEQFALYGTELLKWNQKINLTAITDPAEIAIKHFIDSIAPLPLIPPDSVSLLDIGSGGGFPGIPLKIMLPSLSVTLIDASRKKVNFQKQIIRMLDIKNIKAIHTRGEELPKNKAFVNAFDVVICRAFSALDRFVSMALPLVAKKGMIIALKGKLSEAERESLFSLKEIDKERFSTILNTYTLPFTDAERSLFVLKLKE